MRGQFEDQGKLFSYISPEQRVPIDHPLRAVRAIVRFVLRQLHGDFAKIYSHEGRPSIAPEQLLSALLLQALYGIRSERQLMEQLDYNLLYRWFVGLAPDDAVWVATSFTKNRERLQQADIFGRFMAELLNHPDVRPLLSSEHFSVDGTLIEAWASQRSFKPKDGSGGDGADFHKQTRSNETHSSVTDPDSRLYKKAKGKESKLCYMGHALMENRNGLAIAGSVSLATGTAEREAAETLLKAKVAETGKPATVGADKAYDVKAHGEALAAINVTAHPARHNAATKTGKKRASIVDDATAASEGYGKSQTIRKRIECIFGFGKQHGSLRKTKLRGRANVACCFFTNLIAYNLIRIPKLLRA
jgi:transposase